MNRFFKSSYFFLFIFFIIVSCFPSAAQERQQDTAADNSSSESVEGPWFLSLYKKYISPVDGDRCPSYPSCSSYSAAAFKKHGFFLGWIMTVDRLIHEGKEEADVSALVSSEGKWKIFDPVENNDFWWYQKDVKDKEKNE